MSSLPTNKHRRSTDAGTAEDALLTPHAAAASNIYIRADTYSLNSSSNIDTVVLTVEGSGDVITVSSLT